MSWFSRRGTSEIKPESSRASVSASPEQSSSVQLPPISAEIRSQMQDLLKIDKVAHRLLESKFLLLARAVFDDPLSLLASVWPGISTEDIKALKAQRKLQQSKPHNHDHNDVQNYDHNDDDHSEDGDNPELKLVLELSTRLARAEFLDVSIPGVEVTWRHGNTFAEKIQSGDVLCGYDSPSYIEFHCDFGQALQELALRSGCSPQELADIFLSQEKPGFPRGLASVLRVPNANFTVCIPVWPEATDDDPKAFAAKYKEELQQKFRQAKIVNNVQHGWTGSAETMINSVDQDGKTDVNGYGLADSFFANLADDEVDQAMVIGIQAFTEFTSDVNLQNGYGPADYALLVVSVLNLLGVFNGNAVPERQIQFAGHSMGGGALAHIMTRLGEKMFQRLPNFRWSFTLLHPAAIFARNGQEHNPHYWASPNAVWSNENGVNALIQAIIAELVQKGQYKLRQSLTLNERNQVLTELYKKVEGVVSALITNGKFLARDPTQMARHHLTNLSTYLFEAACCATGSVKEPPVEMPGGNETQINQHSNHIIVTAAGRNIQDEMVNASETVRGLPTDEPVVVLENGSHYAFKWSENQIIYDILTKAQRQLTPHEWAAVRDGWRLYYEIKRVNKTEKTIDALVKELMKDEHKNRLARVLEIEARLVGFYLRARDFAARDIRDHGVDADIYQLLTPTIQEQAQHKYNRRCQKTGSQDWQLRDIYSVDDAQFARLLEGITESEIKQLSKLELMLRAFDLVGPLVHYNQPDDAVITGKW